jgi:hypothetical protein
MKHLVTKLTDLTLVLFPPLASNEMSCHGWTLAYYRERIREKGHERKIRSLQLSVDRIIGRLGLYTGLRATFR